jgi:hypothetical protein
MLKKECSFSQTSTSFLWSTIRLFTVRLFQLLLCVLFAVLFPFSPVLKLVCSRYPFFGSFLGFLFLKWQGIYKKEGKRSAKRRATVNDPYVTPGAVKLPSILLYRPPERAIFHPDQT